MVGGGVSVVGQCISGDCHGGATERGELVDFITTVRRVRHGLQYAIRSLQGHNTELRTLFWEANRRVTTAQAERTWA